jgi:hypothetical protein
MKLLILFILIIFSENLMAQEKSGLIPDFRISQGTYISTGNDLPFWMVSNQSGVFTMSNSSYQLTQIGMRSPASAGERDTLKKWGYTYGVNLVYGYAGNSDFHPNEYWAGVRYGSLILKAGAQRDPPAGAGYGGLSSTNGNMYRSGNARPVPGLSLATNGYIPFIFWQEWCSFRFLYEEGLLKDKQYVTDAHLHHKNLYFRALLSSSLSLSLGIEHYAFWGGYSPKYGQLVGWSQYARYVFGLAGGNGSTPTDQNNVIGNQLGSYNLEVIKDLTTLQTTFYWNHPFEDRSGMELDNLRDGLWGIHVASKNKSAFITDVVYEYMNTRNQSGSIELEPAPTPGDPDKKSGRGRDNYFNNASYPSGYTHYQRMMGTPLFVPKIGADGISLGFESTRMWMHHLGLSGALGNGFYWKSLMTWTSNFGTYVIGYPRPLNEFSFLAEGSYNGSKLPFIVKAGVAGDYGDRFPKRVGGYLGIEINL